MIRELLENKTQSEKADIKATEIAKLDLVGETTKDNIKIEIVEMNKIEGGVEFSHLIFGFSEPIHKLDNHAVKEYHAVVFED